MPAATSEEVGDGPEGAPPAKGSPAPVVDARAENPIRDGELVRRVRRGDRWALEALFRRHAGMIAGTVMRLLRDRAEAEDVVQDTFATAIEKLETLREPEAVRGWLLMIAIRGVQQRLRRRRLRRFFGLADDHPDDDLSCVALAVEGASPELRAELALLDVVLAQLPANQRIAWSLRHVEGYALDETAQACGCSLATVKRRIATAERVIAARVRLAPEGEVDHG